MKKIITLSLLLLVCQFAMAQNDYIHFYELFNEGDSTAIAKAIDAIRSSGDQSAERYIAEYNYYVNKSLLYSGMVMTEEYPDESVNVVGDIMTLSDSTGAVAGYGYFVQNWDEEIADSALLIISQGIVRYPDRLDMRYGKIHFLRQLQRWNEYAGEIHLTLNYAETHRKTMVFPDNPVPIDTTLISGVLDYERTLLDAILNSPDSVIFANRTLLLRGVAEHMLHLYPKDVYSMNVMAVTYQLVEDRKNSLKWLLKAEKIAPKDAVVLTNIADTYHILGDYKNERKYLEKMIKYGDEETVAKAKQYMEDLNN